MTVKELVLFLSKHPPNMQVIICKEVEASGFGHVDKIELGCFEMTDYGNDFFPDQHYPAKGQVRVVCLYPDKQDWLTEEIASIGAIEEPKPRPN